jgi:hypothetical protein
MLQEHNENITYVLPEEGGNIWVDYLCVPASCIKSALFFKEAAHIPRELQVTLVFVDFTHGEVHRTVKKARSRHFHA